MVEKRGALAKATEKISAEFKILQSQISPEIEKLAHEKSDGEAVNELYDTEKVRMQQEIVCRWVRRG